MNKKTKVSKPFTKQEIKAIIKLWETKTTQEIAAEINRSTGSVQYMANVIRKSGYHLPRKSQKGTIRLLVKEVLNDLKLI